MTSVLFVVDHLDAGGAPIVVRDLIWGLVDQGASVTLVVLSDRVAHALPPQVPCICLPFTPNSRFERARRYALHAQQLDNWLSQQNGTGVDAADFDLVVAHLHHAHQVVSRSRLANRAWYCLHADPVVAFLGNKSGLTRRIKRLKVARLYSGRKVIGVSQGIIDRLRSVMKVRATKAVCLHNPLDLEAIRRQAMVSPHDVPERFLLFVGRLDQRAKRFDRLLEGYRQSGVDLPLLIVGEGGDRPAVRQQVERLGLENNVTLLGHRDTPYGYMKRATALLLSSDYEGFPLVIAEALACGTPVVSTDCPSGPREILTGELSRYLVPMNDTSAFADAIRDVVKQPITVPEQAVSELSRVQVVTRYLALAKR
ncbi:MAG: glycosyltransferase [Halomonas subglaciescola]|nr:glycosyltransferase [Halomonas subglaciescola]